MTRTTRRAASPAAAGSARAAGTRASVQEALYRIASAASAAHDLGTFYAAIHAIVGELIYAENFYIALYDSARDALSYAYNVDTVDPEVLDPRVWHRLGATRLGRGTTAYLLRSGRPVHMTIERFHELEHAGEVDAVGQVQSAGDWIGAPLVADGRTLGAVVCQSYVAEHTYDDADLELLAFVGQHIGTALSRAQAIEETRDRNAELALINDVQRGLAAGLDMQAMYDLVGDKVRDTFDSHAVDIGIVDRQAGMIRFVYSVERGVHDQGDAIPIGGLRQQVIESGEPLRTNRDLLGAVADRGGIHRTHGKHRSRCCSRRSRQARPSQG